VVPRSITLVFKVLSTLVQNCGVKQFQTGAQQIIEGPGALYAATSRGPRTAPVRQSPRRPHLHIARATRLPYADVAPQGASFLSRAARRCSSSTPNTARRAPGGPPVRSALRRTRTPAEAPPYHGGIHAVTPSSPPDVCSI
jgi:hypothetical protein